MRTGREAGELVSTSHGAVWAFRAAPELKQAQEAGAGVAYICNNVSDGNVEDQAVPASQHNRTAVFLMTTGHFTQELVHGGYSRRERVQAFGRDGLGGCLYAPPRRG